MAKYRVNAGEKGQKTYKGENALDVACTAALLYLESGCKATVERPAGRGGKGWAEVKDWLPGHLLRHATAPKASPVATRPGLAKTGSREQPSGRIPWSQREYRVLSNAAATPKMHETLESAIGAGKRHIEAGRVPVIERLVDGKWLPVVGWEQSGVSPNVAMRW